jgi:hypothetical protein
MSAQVIQFRYSRKSSFIGIGLLLVMFLLLLRTCILSYYVHDITGTVVFGILGTIIVAVMGIMVYYRLIPALKGEIALELYEQGIKDYIRHITIDWNDVEDIFLQPGRSASMLVFELKFDSDFGKRVHVLLRWVEGSDRDIYDTVLAYFDEIEGIVRE